MPTDIMKRPDDTLLIAHSDEWKSRNRNRDCITWICDILGKGHTYLGSREQAFLLQIEKYLACIRSSRQSSSGFNLFLKIAN